MSRVVHLRMATAIGGVGGPAPAGERRIDGKGIRVNILMAILGRYSVATL